jgi:hypothetical protein
LRAFHNPNDSVGKSREENTDASSPKLDGTVAQNQGAKHARRLERGMIISSYDRIVTPLLSTQTTEDRAS